MAFDAVKKKYIPRDNDFYRRHYHYILYSVMVMMVLMMCAVGVVFYQTLKRPLPTFAALQVNGTKMALTPYDTPNLLPETLLRWASKAATTAYKFDFYNYNVQIAANKPSFTEAGWRDYMQSVEGLISTIVENKLFVSGIVSGTPVIANQGVLPGTDYAWRIQIPFLVVYQSANLTTTRNFLVSLTIVRIPTNINPQGIGIDQIVMVQQ